MLSLGVPVGAWLLLACVCVRETGAAPPLVLRNARPSVRLGEELGESRTRSEGTDEQAVPIVLPVLVLVRPDDQLSSLFAPARLLSAVPGRLSRPLLLLLLLLTTAAPATCAVRKMMGDVSGVPAVLDGAEGARLSLSERDWALASSLEKVDGRRISWIGDDVELLVGGAMALVLLWL